MESLALVSGAAKASSSGSSTSSTAMLCVGCGTDLSARPKDRRNLGAQAKCSEDMHATRERVLSTWRELASNMEISESRLKMCRQCFRIYEQLEKLLSQVRNNLQVASTKVHEVTGKSSGEQTTPTRRKRTSEDLALPLPKKRRVEVQDRITVAPVGSSSPPVAVSARGWEGVGRWDLKTCL